MNEMVLLGIGNLLWNLDLRQRIIFINKPIYCVKYILGMIIFDQFKHTPISMSLSIAMSMIKAKI